MKKTYTKPQISFEDFSLSTSIAGDCEQTTNATRYVCAYVVGRGSNKKNVFSSTMVGICDYTEVVGSGADMMYNGICYHVPAEDNNLFNS